MYDSTYLMWLSCPPLAQEATAGRFLMINCGSNHEMLLPRPMSYHRFRNETSGERQFSILYDVRGKGTSWLSTRSTGDKIYMFGPLGKGFNLENATKNILLIAGGIGIAAMPALIDNALEKGKSITLLQGARSISKLMPLQMLPKSIKVVSATDDGSSGYHGKITDLIPKHLPSADQCFACGPNAMFESIGGIMQEEASKKSVQALLEERMGCGTGICYGCTVKTKHGTKLICIDGPQFDLTDIYT